jgi:hypothetical protein
VKLSSLEFKSPKRAELLFFGLDYEILQINVRSSTQKDCAWDVLDFRTWILEVPKGVENKFSSIQM